MSNRRSGMLYALLLICCVFLYFCDQASGEIKYPTKGIDIICGAGPGGSNDLTARLISSYVSKVWGVPVNVINKTGGMGIPAALEVMTAKPDGYTMYAGAHAVPMLGAFRPNKLPYDWRKFTFVCRVTRDPLVYFVRPDAPWKTLKEVTEFVKKNQKKLRWGSFGQSGIGFAAGLQLFFASNISIDSVQQVFFPSGAKVLTALAGSHIDFAAQQPSEGSGLIQGGNIRPLASVTQNRLRDLPGVPTVAEAGYPMLDVHSWHGINGPPGLPKDIEDIWYKTLQKASSDPTFLTRAENLEKIVHLQGGKEFREFVEFEYQKYLTLAKEAGGK